RATVPSVAVPFLNVTFPVGMPVVWGATTAVNFTACPTVDGFGDPVIDVVVLTCTPTPVTEASAWNLLLYGAEKVALCRPRVVGLSRTSVSQPALGCKRTKLQPSNMIATSGSPVTATWPMSSVAFPVLVM